VNLDADDLLAQIQRDWPAEYERSRLLLLVARQDEEIQRLTAEVRRLTGQPAGYRTGNPEVTSYDLTAPQQ
jgi:hypothetical protein